MRRIFMLMALALMLTAAMALSGVAQAASPSAKCKLAAGLVDSSGYKFIAGSDRKNDNFTSKATAGADVFCGFGGNDSIGTLDAGDIFIGGDGLDTVTTNNGAFYGGDGDDSVTNVNTGTFNGEAGNDSVRSNEDPGIFNGSVGDDSVAYNYSTFNADSGYDSVSNNYGTFYGSNGLDTVDYNSGNGTLDSVEVCNTGFCPIF